MARIGVRNAILIELFALLCIVLLHLLNTHCSSLHSICSIALPRVGLLFPTHTCSIGFSMYVFFAYAPGMATANDLESLCFFLTKSHHHYLYHHREYYKSNPTETSTTTTACTTYVATRRAMTYIAMNRTRIPIETNTTTAACTTYVATRRAMAYIAMRRTTPCS